MSTIKEKSIHLWTVQRHEAWKVFQRLGVLRGDGRRVDRSFLPAYHWMMEQMKKRLPAYKGRFPVWSWYQPKPDLRCKGFLPAGSRGVRIEFAKPREQVLLSDFGSWHCILDNHYLPLTEAEQQEWEMRLRERGRNGAVVPPDLQEMITRSWERIFDLEAINASEMMGPVTEIQAVVEEILLDEVIRVTEFIAR